MNLYVGLFFFGFLLFAIEAQTYRKACYYTNWAQYRTEPGKFFPENVDPTLCTHVIYSFAGMANNEITTIEWNDVDMYARFAKLRAKNPQVKLMIAIAGWTFDLTKMTAMLSSASTRAQFIRSVVAFLRKHNFDGFDLDFEWPGRSPSPSSDRQLYTSFVQELRSAFNNKERNNEKLILSIAVPAAPASLDVGFEIAKIAQNVDFITLMSYDYNGAWNSVTGHNSPLYPPSNNPGDKLNIKSTIEYMEGKGVPMSKLNLGIPFYGRGFVLSNPGSHGLGAPSKGASPAGPTTKEAGYLSYYEIMEYVNDPATKIYKPCDIQVPYLVKGDLWVGYDDVDSIANKADFIKKKGLGGFSVWAIDLDDFKGTYGTTYPLLKKLNEIDSPNFVNTYKCSSKHHAGSPSPGSKPQQPADPSNPVAPPSNPVAPPNPPVAPPHNGNHHSDTYNCENKSPCTAQNIASHKYLFASTDPSKFIQCFGVGTCYTMSCPPSLVWQQKIISCNHRTAHRHRNRN